MVTFRTGAAIKQPNPTTILNKQIQQFLSANANPDTGTVTDPGVYGKALQMASGDNSLDGLKLQSDLQNKLDALKAKLNNAYATKGMIDYEFKNAQYNIGKMFALDPPKLIQNMYSLYDLHGTEIENHINKMKNDGLDASSLATYGGQVSDEVNHYERLFDAINQHGMNSPQVKQEAQNFGMAIGTDSDGKIISFALHVLPDDAKKDAQFTLKGANDTNGTTYIRTTATYSGIPVYVTPQSDPKDPSGNTYIAKVGDLTFAGTKKSTGQNALSLADMRPWYEKVLEGGPDLVKRLSNLVQGHGNTTASNGQGPSVGDQGIAHRQNAEITDTGSQELFGHIKPDDFSNMTTFPAGTTAMDLKGNYYHVNDDGTLFAAPNIDIMSDHLSVPPDKLKNVPILTPSDLQLLQSQQSPDDRANMWLKDPTENSPMNQISPTSMLNSPNQPGISFAQPAATQTPPIPAGPPAPPRAIQQSHGSDLAQESTRKIVTSQNNPSPLA